MANGRRFPRIKLVRALDLGEIFAMPLNALIDADVFAAETFANFVKEFGFEKDLSDLAPPGDPFADPGDSFGKLRMVTFTYERPMRDGAMRAFRTEIPWLSLVPLPNLTIETADLSFAVDFLGSTEVPEGAPDRSSGEPAALALRTAQRRPPPSQLAGRVRRKRLRHMARMAAAPRPAPAVPPSGAETPAARSAGSSSATAQIRCEVKIRRSDLPTGIAGLLNLMGQAVEDSEEAATLRLDSNRTTLTTMGQKAVLIATLRAADGRPIADAPVEVAAEPSGVVSLPDSPYTTDADGKAMGSIAVAALPAEATAVLIRASSTVPGPSGNERIAGSLTVEIRRPQPLAAGSKSRRRRGRAQR
jgi:hypothetical protein